MDPFFSRFEAAFWELTLFLRPVRDRFVQKENHPGSQFGEVAVSYACKFIHLKTRFQLEDQRFPQRGLGGMVSKCFWIFCKTSSTFWFSAQMGLSSVAM